MSGYWPGFFCFAQKKNEASNPDILTEDAWSIKDLLYDFFRALKRKPFACTI